MTKGRIEAFSDGVLAIIITIMVLELKVPHGTSPKELIPLIPIFLSYALSFVYVAIYWNNHHHLFQLVKHIKGNTLWYNSHLLFWLSLVPFATAWAGENHFTAWPLALYGVILFMAATAYRLLTRHLIALQGKESSLNHAIGRAPKEWLSIALYLVAIGMAFLLPELSVACYVIVAVMWFAPEKRIEKESRAGGEASGESV